MFVVFDIGQKVPIKIWLKDRDSIDANCLEQAINLSKHPTVFHHAALMPDTHWGYGMCIGGVIGCRNAVIPYAVGSDIGCGMGYIKTNIPAELVKMAKGANDIPLLKEIIRTIDRQVPTGKNRHSEPQDWSGFESAPDIHTIQKEIDNARHQLGTLGGGNHFIEFQECEDGNLCIMLHSGSRNFGKQMCDHYNKLAEKLNARWHSAVDPKWELSFLPIDSDEGQEYIVAMNYALEFAQENRNRMLQKIKNIAFNYIDKYVGSVKKDIIREINVHHNYAALEHHFGEDIWVHRKGAIRMRKGDVGVIPGSMGTPSYVVEGLGNEDSFSSGSHGAGRRMGRAQASRDITLERANKTMEGIIFNGWGNVDRGKKTGDIDLGEAPDAYKNIDEVIENERDLVSVIEKVRPIAVVKA